MKMYKSAGWTVVMLFIFILSATGQPLTPQVDSIPMRDNKKLAADVYLPGGGTAPRPTILIQTPYNRLLYRYGLPLGIGLQINTCQYNIVILDWRGFWGSAAAAVTQPNRGYDGYDAVEWIANQSWSDGNVGTWGPSALGRVQFLTAKENPPHLKCMVPVVAAPYYKYSEYYPGGVLRTEYVQQLDQLGFGLGALVYPNPFYNLIWQYTESNSTYPQSIQVPCFMVGGWYDHAIDEMTAFFASIKTSSPVAVRDKHKMLVGPWVHGGHSTAYVGSSVQGELNYPLAAGWSDSLALMFFDYYLRGIQNNWNLNQSVMYYNLGEHTWNQSPQWLPVGQQNLTMYLNDNQTLTLTSPTSVYTWNVSYDPADPSPTIGGATLRNDLLQGPYDQSLLVESRNDALVFTSDVFTEPVYLCGKAKVTLYIQTDRKDTDFAIRLCDVYPDGRSMLLSDGIKRCRFLNGYSVNDTASLSAGTTYQVEINLSQLSQVFMPGHRMRLTITGSNYPRYDNNLNNGGDMYVSGDTLVAQNIIYSGNINASKIEFTGQLMTGTGNITLTHGTSVYPNPSSGFVFVPSGQYDCNWSVTDVSGKLVMEVKPDERNRIDLTSLSSGLYFLRETNSNVFYKIIRQND